jgi:small subunit ribosomal protein S1
MEQSVVVSEVGTTGIKTKAHYTGKVIHTGLAGAVVDIGTGKPALLHVSQIQSPDNQPIKRVEDVLKVDQEIDVWVKKIKDERVELTMFKPLDYEWRDLKEDMVVKGKVVRLEKFGAFIEIGAERPGLIHISEMAHGYVRTPGDVLKENDEVEVKIIEINRKKKQIKLSIKALTPEPEPVQMPASEPQHKEKSPRKGKKGGSRKESVELFESSSSEPEPTAMEIAIREAMDKAKEKSHNPVKPKKANFARLAQEEIYNRTLENKVQTK